LPVAEEGHVRNEYIARRWFTEGWAGDVALADLTFDDGFTSNGTIVGPTVPKREVQNRIMGFPDLQIDVESVIAAGDQVVIRLRWSGGHMGYYGGVQATGRPVEVIAIVIWRFCDGKVLEEWAVEDQFGFFRQVGAIPSHLYLNRPAHPMRSE
jgi:predicted ester cyclase